MPVITTIADLKRLHKRRTPKMFYDYAENGSWTEQTFRENTSDFDQIRLRQRVAVDMTNRTTKSQMIGQDVAMPVALAPVGLTGMQCADGEIKAAKAAEKFGVPFTLSTMSICSIEDVAENTTKPFWFQVYTLKDDDFMRRLFERARAAGCSAIVITLDLQVMGQRHKDLKNGLSAPPKFTIASMADLATKWSWGLQMLGTKRRFFGNIVGHASGVSDPSSLASWTAEAFDHALDWKRVATLMEMWGGKVILKGILDVEDAKMAAKLGGGCHHRVQPRWPSVGWCAVFHPYVACNPGCRRRQGRGPYGQRYSLWSGRAQGAWRWGKGHLYRPRFCQRIGCDGRGWRDQGLGSHSQGTRHHDGPLRQARHSRCEPRYFACSQRV